MYGQLRATYTQNTVEETHNVRIEREEPLAVYSIQKLKLLLVTKKKKKLLLDSQNLNYFT